MDGAGARTSSNDLSGGQADFNMYEPKGVCLIISPLELSFQPSIGSTHIGSSRRQYIFSKAIGVHSPHIFCVEENGG